MPCKHAGERSWCQATVIRYAFVLEEGCIALSGEGKDLLANSHIKKLYLGLGDER